MTKLLFILTHPNLILAFIKESTDVWHAAVALARQVQLETKRGSHLHVLAENLETQVTEARTAFKKLLGDG